MKIELVTKTIKEIFEGYIDEGATGSVVAFGGKLNVRPEFQREFVYKEKQQQEVMRTIWNKFPLNVMYWSKNKDGTYDLIDGQQRTLSICKYLNAEYSVNFQDNPKFSNNLTRDELKRITDYELQIYICDGTESEKIEWFRIINIAGERLNNQEILNSVYRGPWITAAKKYFSKPNSAAKNVAESYMSANVERQEYLEKALIWISQSENKTIEEYMAEHQNDQNANALIEYYEKVFDWADSLFKDKSVFNKTSVKRIGMGLDWGRLYNKYSSNKVNAKEFAKKAKELLDMLKTSDPEITNVKGIVEYLLSGEEKYLSLRQFSIEDMQKKYEEQKGICPMCKGTANASKKWKFEEMQGDHIVPWSKGGKTTYSNLQMLCRKHNQEKSNH